MSLLENVQIVPRYAPTSHLWVDVANWEHAEKVLAYDDGFTVQDSPIKVIKVGSRYFLLDGHHRLVNAVNQNFTSVVAIVTHSVVGWADLPMSLTAYLRDIEFGQCPCDSLTIVLKEQNETTNLLVSYNI